MARLDGKIALLTGGSSGIGEATAARFVDEGASVVVVDRRAPGEGLQAALATGRLAYVEADLLDAAQVARAVEAAVPLFGGLDILVNNAGAPGPTTPIVDTDPDDWDRIFALQVRAPMLAIKHAAPLMRARGGGSVINVSSAAGMRPVLSSGAAYAASKAALQKLTVSAAVELAPDLIRVNALLPGGVVTPIVSAALGVSPEGLAPYMPELERIYREGQPLPVAGLPRHLADAALFLASSESEFVTGAELIVDGGLTLTPGSRPKGAQMAALAARIAAGG